MSSISLAVIVRFVRLGAIVHLLKIPLAMSEPINNEMVIHELRKEREDLSQGNNAKMDTIAGALLEQFPKELADYITSVANNSRQYPEHFIFPVLSAFSYAASLRYFLITPEYTTRPNLYFMTIGRKGSGKTHGHKIGLAPIREIEKKLFDQYEFEKEEWSRKKEAGPEPRRMAALLTSSTSIEQIEQTVLDSHCVLFDLDEFHGMLNRIQDKHGGDRYSSFFNKNYSDASVNVNYKTARGGYSDRATNVQMCSTQPVFFSKLLSGEIYHSGLADRYLYMPLLRDKKPAHRNSGIRLNHQEYINKVMSLYKGHSAKQTELQLSDDAYFKYVDLVNELGATQKAEVKDSIIYGYFDKIDVALPKLAIIYHAMHSVYTKKQVDEVIQVESVTRAFNTCLMAVNAFRLCLAEFQNEQPGPSLTKSQVLKEFHRLYPHVTQYKLAELTGFSRQNINQLINSKG